MNRRKYLLSTFGLGTGIGIASQYNTSKPAIATNINLTDGAINVSEDILDASNPKLDIDFTKFEINPINFYGANPDYIIKARTKYNGNYSETEILTGENPIPKEDISDEMKSQNKFISLELPSEVKEDETIEITVEFQIDTTNEDIGPFYETKNIYLNFGNPFETEPSDLNAVLEDMSGSGTENDPYQITNIHELQAMNADVNANYELVNNIDASNTDKWYKTDEITEIINSVDSGDTYSSAYGNIKDVIQAIDIDTGEEIEATVEDNQIKFIEGTDDEFGDARVKYRLFDIISLGFKPIGCGESWAQETVRKQKGFGGILNGNNHKIINLSINRFSEEFVGLIGFGRYERNNVDKQSFIKNIILENVNVKGKDSVGGLLGRGGSKIINAHSSGNVESIDERTGGLVGASFADITKSSSTCDVIGDTKIGGLVGQNSDNSIIESYATGDVTAQGIGNNRRSHCGGLIGWFYRGDDVENSYATGNVYSEGEYAGGIIGSNQSANLINSYSIGNVISNNSGDVGGDVGRTGSEENTYWDKTFTIEKDGTDVSEQGSGTPLTTDDMKGSEAANSMDKLDFDEIWETVEGDYPVLQDLDTQEQLDNR